MRNFIPILILFASLCSFGEDDSLFFSREDRDQIHSYCQQEAEIMSITLYARYKKNIDSGVAIKRAIESDLPDHLKLKTLAIIENAYTLEHPKEPTKQSISMNIGASMQYTLCLKSKYQKYFDQSS